MKTKHRKQTVITPPRLRKVRTGKRADKYDKAIAYITSAGPTLDVKARIFNAWNFPYDTDQPAGCLFQRANATGYTETSNGERCGCLTQIAGLPSDYNAETAALTAAIRKDKRLPGHVDEIRRKHLPLFAAWQRKIDKILKRK